MRCPNCGSENAHFVSNTTSNGPSISKGCCGWFLFGPIGILCSFCGMGSETTEYWVCNSCGKRFYSGEYEAELNNKNDKVTNLQKDIAALEEELKNKPENFPELISAAKEDYDMAAKEHDSFEKDFINSSSVLKIADTICTLVIYGTVILAILGILAGILSLGDGGFTIIIISIVIGILVLGITATILAKIQTSVDAEKAEQLSILKKDMDAKKKIYKDLQEIQRKSDAHDKKVNELVVAEQDLNNYQNKHNNNE